MKVVWFVIIVLWAMLINCITEVCVSPFFSDDETLKALKMTAKSSLVKMTEEDRLMHFLELAEDKLNCCGINGVEDYYGMNITNTTLPSTCINKDTGNAFEKGCYEAMIDHFKVRSLWYKRVFIVLLGLQLIMLLIVGVFMLGIMESVVAGLKAKCILTKMQTSTTATKI